ncbi:CAP domain-containing protein [Polaromonas sp.]|uniref:CAP domain-containing protein n=1 Tax=Polaromonas sp. TaxID=1869339 RepID=UPI00248A7884|nr:CAP domain-containing protein [Polaromonas sp.]MDI1338963.1 CAP domain-containing protein [Polaromonas sp.]
MNSGSTPLTKKCESWRNAAGSLALALLAATGPVQAQSDSVRQPGLLRDINAVRQQGCEGQAGKAAPLRENAALSAAAARLASGDRLDEALKSAGYRAVNGAQIILRGAGATLLTRASLGSSCSVLTQADLTEAGFHHHAAQTWIVVAAPFTPPGAAQADDLQSRVLALVNEARAQPRRYGNETFPATRPLHFNAKLQTVAAAHAADMARYNYFDHAGRDGNHVEERASSSGYRWRAIGENIAAGHTMAEAAMQDWLQSPEHCANVMSPAYTEMGAAFAVNNNSSAGIYWVKVFGAAR